ncbi:hypothetical protein BDDG_08868 [Blastomyces dermatitidis ATCC 18188]|uniref:Uncharacterized protein n=1 Tax=Ajellomyces dermatitidis (strain ATCC 18188 / CBS 674.68) TaxID=653446 RepID=F2TRR0_AJEDA|nr:hypothetical protein BDDG_08868 [Blastomyces dermatitidis ATCC 18188]EQL30925.1 hypothetical protein BDFG_06682 [Blastomyces dermatitidis ATCC 26199]
MAFFDAPLGSTGTPPRCFSFHQSLLQVLGRLRLPSPSKRCKVTPLAEPSSAKKNRAHYEHRFCKSLSRDCPAVELPKSSRMALFYPSSSDW